MKKTLFASIFIFTLALQTPVFAQGMMGQLNTYNMMGSNQNLTGSTQSTDQTAADEAAGKDIWNKLQAKQVDCKSLTDDNYDVLGDYFMGLMAGGSHASMNDSMVRMMGADGEKQMHVAMGKRLSGCDTNAAFPEQYQQFSSQMPMMGGFNNQNFPMMRGGFNSQYSPWNGNMMGENGFPEIAVVSSISLLLVWTVLILSIAALVRYLKSSKRK